MTVRAPHVLLCALVCAGACGDPGEPEPTHWLEGSLLQVMDLGYDEARIRFAAEDVSLTFVRLKTLRAVPATDGGEPQEAGTTEEYPLVVAYRFVGEGRAPAGNQDLDLTAVDDTGRQRGVVSRNVSNDPRNVFPGLVRGRLVFHDALQPQSTVTGSFHVTFENGVEVASGRTVFTNAWSALVQP